MPRLRCQNWQSSGAAGHGAEEVGVDLDHLLHRLRGDVRALRRARVHRDDHAVLEDETEGGGAVVGLDVVHHLALELVVLRAEEGARGVRSRAKRRARGVPRPAGWEYPNDVRARIGGGGAGEDGGRGTHVVHQGKLEVLRVDVGVDLGRAAGGRGSTGRRQRGEKRPISARGVPKRGPRRTERAGSTPRGSGTHHSASSLSDARTGASSTEKSSFISPIRRGRARARRSLRASTVERTSASFKLPCGLPRAIMSDRPRTDGVGGGAPTVARTSDGDAVAEARPVAPPGGARVSREGFARRATPRLARAASLPPRAATGSPSAPSRWRTRTSAADLAVVLVTPQIPGNTGTIARTCAATRVPLHLVGPLGFTLEDSQLKPRLDHWRVPFASTHPTRRPDPSPPAPAASPADTLSARFGRHEP